MIVMTHGISVHAPTRGTLPMGHATAAPLEQGYAAQSARRWVVNVLDNKAVEAYSGFEI